MAAAAVAAAGKLDLEVDLKSPADKYWSSLINSTELFPKIFPEQYKSIELLEGDGKTVGSLRKITYGEAIPIVTAPVKERVDSMDEASKTVSYTVVEGDLLSLYKTFTPTLQVVPKGDGSAVKWSVAYEKSSDEVPDPDMVAQLATKTFTDLDEYLLKN